MRTFLIVWFGQLISLLGSKLTEFALGFWILEQTYRDTGTITQFALTILLIYLPKVIVSPFAGVLIDRWNRRYAMIMSDVVTTLITIIVIFLVSTNQLEVWHIYLAITVTSTFNAFQTPASTAAIAQVVPPEHYSRANGMVQVSSGVAKIVSPFIAGILMKFIGLEGVLTIDLGTFFVALFTLSIVRFPNVKRRRSRNKSATKIFLQDTISGWNYIATRPGLLRLISFVSISFFTTGMVEVVIWPLLYKPDSTQQLGTVLSIGGCGVLLGSLLMSIWGNTKYRVITIVGCVGLQGIVTLFAGLKISVIVLAVGVFLYLFSHPILVSSNQAIWQSKVPTHLHGRIFALIQSLERSLAVIAYLLAGPLVDTILNPLMAEGGLLHYLTPFIGGQIGQDGGISLLLVLLGIFNLILVAIAFKEPRLLNLETELPDRNVRTKKMLLKKS